MYRTMVAIAINGTVIEDVPINLQDKLAYEKTARARKWSESENPVTTNAFLGWHAARRLGQLDMSFEEFLSGAEDVSVRLVDGGSITGTDPTPAARSQL